MDSVFFITGSSKGIGKGLVEAILAESEKNFVVGISRSNSLEHERFAFVEADLSRDAEPEKVAQEVFKQYKPTGRAVLVNNAGTLGQTAYFGTLDNKKVQQAFQLNVTAPAILMNEFIKTFGQGEVEPIIVNISSGAGKYAVDGWSAYCASKAALDMLSHAAALEAGKKGSILKVFALSPGVVDTEMQSEIRSTEKKDFTRVDYFKQLKEEGGLASPEEVARKILKLINNPGKFEGVLQDVREF